MNITSLLDKSTQSLVATSIEEASFYRKWFIVRAYDLKSLILLEGKVGGSLISSTLGKSLASGIMMLEPNIFYTCTISVFLDM